MSPSLIQLQCGANTYEWGKKGSKSAAARFAAATPSTDFQIDEQKPYAEVGVLVSDRADSCRDVLANACIMTSSGWAVTRQIRPRTSPPASH